MIILPAIDLKDGKCVRLFQGDYRTAEVVAEDPVRTAKHFVDRGARWMHMVDLDGAKSGKPENVDVIMNIRNNTKIKMEIGGGIRNMETVDTYLDKGIDRVILGSAALQNPRFVEKAIQKYGKQIAVGIDAIDGKVAIEGWTDRSEVDYLDLAKRIDEMGVSYIIFTDIKTDGTLNGPNLDMLDKINNHVSCNIIASGGVSSLLDVINLYDLKLYGAITGKALYANALDLSEAIMASQRILGSAPKTKIALDDHIDRYFMNADLIPAIIQEAETDKVLMLAYMNREALERTAETGYTWFYSRSRQRLWNKGETSGNTQKVVSISSDCDDDTLLIKVHQKGVACHTGSHSCFFKDIYTRSK